MEVVTYLTSALLVAVSIALVVLGFRFDVRLRRQAWRPPRTEPELPPAAGGPAGTHSGPGMAPGPSLDGFTLHYQPVEEDLHVYSRLALFAPVTRPVIVHNGGHFQLFGPCAASLVVRPGGAAVVYDLVTGDAVNEGGELHVHGKVLGAVRRTAGNTVIHPLASVARPFQPEPPALA